MSGAYLEGDRASNGAVHAPPRLADSQRRTRHAAGNNKVARSVDSLLTEYCRLYKTVPALLRRGEVVLVVVLTQLDLVYHRRELAPIAPPRHQPHHGGAERQHQHRKRGDRHLHE